MNDLITILKKQVELIKPDAKTLKELNKTSSEFCQELKKSLKKNNIDASVFVGGSLAKNTIIKKNKYDIDVFVRFNRKYKDNEISRLLGKIICKKAKRIHGSRDYYQCEKNNLIIEIIPVLKIQKPEQAENVTDLSYFHVKYVLDKMKKNKKLCDEIRIAKAFFHAHKCYGAESYVHGFSGYSIELLLVHYKNFLNMIKEIAKVPIDKKLIIDDSKFYNKKEVLIEMNESKLNSPIILVDPTFRDRNALAGLSEDTFFRFKEACKDFLKYPSMDSFKEKSTYEQFKEEKDLIKLIAKTEKQKGDIAGTKLKKFFDFLITQITREFIIKRSGFEYDDEKNHAEYYFVLDKKPDEIIKGPPVIRVEHLVSFKKAHANAYVKGDYAYVEIKHDISFEEFLKKLKHKYNDIMIGMGVKELEVVK